MFVKDNRDRFSVERMCRVLKISRSTFYSWLNRPKSAREIKKIEILKSIRSIFERSKQTYGSPRVHKALLEMGFSISLKTVEKYMKAARIRVEHKIRFAITTDSNHKYPVAKNILNRRFEGWLKGQALVSDLTYIRTQKGWMYYTTVIDLYDRKVIGWSCSTTMKTIDTTIPALKMALNSGRIKENAIFHSDRGVQYASTNFSSLLSQNKLKQSMSKKGDCWDNAVAESFFKTLKQECTNRYLFLDQEQAALQIFDYVETWYNTERIHSANNQKSINKVNNIKRKHILAA